MKTEWISLRRILCLAAMYWALTGLAPHSFGQAIDGNIAGTVFDASAAVVPDAGVTAENVATGFKSQATTGANGVYRFNNILVGTYNITVKKAGFADAVLQNLAVDLNKTVTANVVLQVGAVATELLAIGAPPTIDTTTVQLQNTF